MRSWPVTGDRHVLRLLPMVSIALLLVGCIGRPTPTQVSQSSASPSATGVSTVAPEATSEPDPKPQPQTPTSAPPTPVLTPEAFPERIHLAPGATQATVEGYLGAYESKAYVMHLAEDQYIELNATVGVMGQGLRFSIVGEDGVLVKALGDAHVRTVVPSTQDYTVELVSDVGAVQYRMSLLLPVRIRFAADATSAEVGGKLGPNEMRHYVVRARAGQRMSVVPRANRGKVNLVVSGADGQVLLSGRVGPGGEVYDGILPVSQDYLISVRSETGAGAEYTLEITIPTLSHGRGGLVDRGDGA